MRHINSEKEYNALVNRVNELLEVVSDTNWDTSPEAVELDILSSLIEEYESKQYPIELPSLPDIIKFRMEEMKLNQVQVAELLNVSPSRISEYISGKTEPTLKIGRALCEKLGISPSIILGVTPNLYRQVV